MDHPVFAKNMRGGQNLPPLSSARVNVVASAVFVRPLQMHNKVVVLLLPVRIIGISSYYLSWLECRQDSFRTFHL